MNENDTYNGWHRLHVFGKGYGWDKIGYPRIMQYDLNKRHIKYMDFPNLPEEQINKICQEIKDEELKLKSLPRYEISFDSMFVPEKLKTSDETINDIVSVQPMTENIMKDVLTDYNNKFKYENVVSVQPMDEIRRKRLCNDYMSIYNGWQKNYISNFGWIWFKNNIIVTEVRLNHKNIKFLEFPYLPVDKIQEICNEIELEKEQIKYSSED